MPQIPEDLIKALMDMSGQSRQEVEQILSKSIHEMTSSIPVIHPTTAAATNKVLRDGKPLDFDEFNYPHYLPAEHVMKYTIRVSLRGISPAIWRKFECPSNITLRHLTELILDLMGWAGYHLNHIYYGKDAFYEPYYQRDAEMEMMSSWEHLNQEEATIADILSEKGKTLRFEYDFGDSWEHDIRLSSIDEYAPGEPHIIVFKGGKRACPPEDCGGIWNYADLLDILAKKRARKRLTQEEKEILEWADVDKDFDPEFLDLEECEEVCEDFNEV